MKGLGMLACGLMIAATVSLTTGCAQKKDSPAKDAKVDKKGKAEAHAHGEGPHGGTVTDWGGGKFHVEFTVDHDKQEATVYILGGDEETPAPIKAKEVMLTIKEPALQVNLKPAPQKGDPEGAASAFTGQHKNLGIVREFEGTISGEVDGTPYSGDFKEEPHEEKKT